jgi:predicted DNA-binding transcriptional regulator AlpA
MRLTRLRAPLGPRLFSFSTWEALGGLIMSMVETTNRHSVLISTVEILSLTGMNRKTLDALRADGRFPQPLFDRGGKKWWSRRQVEKALGLDEGER